VAGKVFNVATGERFSLNQTFRILSEIIGYSLVPRRAEARAGDVKHSLADISRTRSAMGYEPTVHFEAGLRQTVAWYKENVVRKRE
jgi:UDP-glucose 4-epimerase